MKIKSILTGLVAFIAAGSFVYAYEDQLQAANAAYLNSEGVCIARDADGCDQSSQNFCVENIPGEGTNIQMLENLGQAEAGEQTTCGDPLFRFNN